MIQEWFKEVLIDGIISNLSGTFDTVNAKVGEIAGEVGMTPSGWNGGIFNMIRSLSETVIVPIAGIDISGVVGDLETTLADWSIGALLGLWFQSIFVGLCAHILTIAIILVIYGRMIEIYLVTSIGPIPFATMVNREWGHTGQNYFRSLLALGFQAFLIMVCVGIYAVLVQNIAVGETVNISAGSRSNYSFNGWTSDDVTIANASSKNASFVMPEKNVTVTAQWKYTGGNSSGGGYTYYTIKATAGVNGAISPSGNVSVREGRDQTFTITPDKGYAISDVKIDGKSVGAVKSYTFENVKGNHTIKAIFMKVNGNPQTGVFVDVPEGSYYEEAVAWAVENGITKGASDTTFEPNGICTRAQIVTFIWRALAE